MLRVMSLMELSLMLLVLLHLLLRMKRQVSVRIMRILIVHHRCYSGVLLQLVLGSVCVCLHCGVVLLMHGIVVRARMLGILCVDMRDIWLLAVVLLVIHRLVMPVRRIPTEVRNVRLLRIQVCFMRLLRMDKCEWRITRSLHRKIPKYIRCSMHENARSPRLLCPPRVHPSAALRALEVDAQLILLVGRQEG